MINIRLLIILGVSISTGLGVCADFEGELETTSDRYASARLVAADAEVAIEFEVEGKTVRNPTAKLVRWGYPRSLRRGPIVTTFGGSRIVAADPSVLGGVIELEDDRLRIDHDLLGEIRMPWRQTRCIIFSLPADLQQRDQLLQRTLPADATLDIVRLENGDELQGTLLALAGDTAMLRSEVGEISLPLDRIEAILLKPPLSSSRRANASALVGLEDGTILSARRYAFSSGKLVVDTAAGVSVAANDVSPVFLQSLTGDFAYLSDKKPAAYRHVPFLSTSWPYQSDRNVLGGQLRGASRMYPKGLGMHSAAQVTYVLGPNDRRFEARLAMDDSAGDRGSVVFRVYLLRSGKWMQAYASEVIRGIDEPVSIAVPLENAKAITLMVDFADRGDELDHANWLDARVLGPASD